MAKRKTANGIDKPKESAKYMNVLPSCHTKVINQYFQPLNKKQAEFIQLIEDKEIVICKGVSGSGKAQPLYSKIYTPDGPITMGEVKVGTIVCTPDGSTAKVTAVYPQGIKDYYRVYFTDNTHVDCCGEHLWKTYTINDRRFNKNKLGRDRSTIIETKEMIGSIIYNNRRNYKLPMTEPVYYNKRVLQLEPYLLGALIGDGSLSSSNLVFSSADEEIINHVRNSVILYGLEINPTKSMREGKSYDYIISQPDRKGSPINYISTSLREMGLRCKSEFKFIPNNYLYSSIEDRIALLQGLMDTDGTVDRKSGCPSFSTSAPKLRDDFCELIRSLGGIATISVKKTGYLDNYVIRINMPNSIMPFRLTRKADLVKPKTKYKTPRYVNNIEYIGEIEQQCISIDSEDHLYLTDNHIVTHNTYCALATALSLLGDTYRQIILVKSLTTVPEESIGYLPGDTMEKMNPYIMSYSWNIDKLLNKKGAASELMKKGIVEVLPLAFVRGLTLDNAIVILDEAQNLSNHTFKTLMTRIGNNSKYIIMGDIEQIDRKRKSESALESIYDIFSQVDEVGHIEFVDEDCVRNPIIPKLIQALRAKGI